MPGCDVGFERTPLSCTVGAERTAVGLFPGMNHVVVLQVPPVEKFHRTHGTAKAMILGGQALEIEVIVRNEYGNWVCVFSKSFLTKGRQVRAVNADIHLRSKGKSWYHFFICHFILET